MDATLKRRSEPSVSLGLAFVISMASAVACGGRSVSSDGERRSSGGSGGSLDASGSGGALATGGIDASVVGGAVGTGGIVIDGAPTIDVDAGSTGGEASGGTAGASDVGANRECKGIRPAVRCPEGQVCGPLVCGLADWGTRTCTCTGGLWGCTECDFSEAPIGKPDVVAACPPEVVDEAPCTELHVVCGPTAAEEYCVCWDSPSDGQTWDCDDPPPSWGL